MQKSLLECAFPCSALLGLFPPSHDFPLLNLPPYPPSALATPPHPQRQAEVFSNKCASFLVFIANSQQRLDTPLQRIYFVVVIFFLGQEKALFIGL